MSNLMWHFCQVDDNGTPHLGYEDNREVRVGETLRVEGEPVLCKYGLHASKRLWNALGYAPSGKLVLCRVTLGGTVKHDDDKSVGNERTAVAMLDVDTTEKLLRDYARWCALQVIHLWDAPDVVRQYLETGDESLRTAAWTAAWDAAWAWDAARVAAWDAARAEAADAARVAAWDAARVAARAAAAAAAWAGAWDAARDSAAVWDAARDAEIGKCVAELERRGLEALGVAARKEGGR